MSVSTRRALLLAAGAGACALPFFAIAQAGYPSKPVRMIVPFPPSGSTDIVARTVADKLASALGQSVVVDNRPGATGAIGLDALARSEPDGHTIGLATIGSIAINPVVSKRLSWDPRRDFAPIGFIGATPFALLVRPDLHASSMAKFIALARSQPNGLTYATGGNGGSQHVASVLLEEMAGISMRQIPYKGSGPALVDLMGGQVDMMIEPAVSAAPHIRSGKVRVLALTGAARSPSFPDVPTVAESVRGYEVAAWFALFAPARTPASVVARINGELRKVLSDPQVIERLSSAGVEVSTKSPDQLAAYLAQELDKWKNVVAKANITAD
ncbi:Bug family tripartite tricarboxylate transporter substrate binding protein [Pseudorhodoferax soli]|uniref:Tripartite-type tricarboxylate transporter receptor subunit TctC n=1 Tax=Pseudorhodoferax soli TaxID=545864 RepID=A0A368XMU0_9BURK|nr:tripartite tricarboxylate transporter substrate binding protein [Pseudorhodoferax soli]RCW68496.1 tripartite-type tricarboxylate transporter receptor subunit TctC [Pseudorhodoferax soli]